MDSLQEQRLMCSYYAGRKHSLHRNVTYSMTNETTEALNLARSSQMLRQGQPLAGTAQLGYLNRWPTMKDRRNRGGPVSRRGQSLFTFGSTARGRALWVSSVVKPSIWRHTVTSSGTCYLLKSGSDH